jgi:hypothetical protein
VYAVVPPFGEGNRKRVQSNSSDYFQKKQDEYNEKKRKM